MEKLIKGEDLADQEEFFGKAAFCAFEMFVKKGHFECGDSAFLYYDKEKLIAGIFDGVSGEPGAAGASSDAAAAILGYLKAQKMPDEKILNEAFSQGHLAIRIGSTTAAIAYLEKDGSFVLAGIGDSPIYGISKKGEISLELPLAREVRENDSILKFFYFRNIVTSVLGGIGETSFHTCSGKLEKGEMLILASDGLNDNLYVDVLDGFVTDASGIRDLKELLKGKKTPKAVLSSLIGEIGKRRKHGRKEEKNRILVPKDDDISIIVIRRT